MPSKHLAWLCSLAVVAAGCAATPPQSEMPASKAQPSVPQKADSPDPSGASLASDAVSKPAAETDIISSPHSAESVLPPNPLEAVAQPGQCWVQTVVYPLPKREPVSVVTRDAATRIVIEPAKLARTLQELIVREGGVTYRIEPPVYKQVKEKILVRPEMRRTIAVPPVYRNSKETVVVESERTVLEPCRIPGADARLEKAARPLCARTLPAKTQTITRKVLVQPATTREEVIPAQYREVTRWVLERPARAVPVDLQPVTAKVPTWTIEQPEQVREETIPAKVRELVRTLYEGEPRVALRQAVCNQEATPVLVKKVQAALKAAGYYVGPIDGKLGLATGRALVAYQRDHGLAAGALTFETLEHLGIQ